MPSSLSLPHLSLDDDNFDKWTTTGKRVHFDKEEDRSLIISADDTPPRRGGSSSSDNSSNRSIGISDDRTSQKSRPNNDRVGELHFNTMSREAQDLFASTESEESPTKSQSPTRQRGSGNLMDFPMTETPVATLSSPFKSPGKGKKKKKAGGEYSHSQSPAKSPNPKKNGKKGKGDVDDAWNELPPLKKEATAPSTPSRAQAQVQIGSSGAALASSTITNTTTAAANAAYITFIAVSNALKSLQTSSVEDVLKRMRTHSRSVAFLALLLVTVLSFHDLSLAALYRGHGGIADMLALRGYNGHKLSTQESLDIARAGMADIHLTRDITHDADWRNKIAGTPTDTDTTIDDTSKSKHKKKQLLYLKIVSPKENAVIGPAADSLQLELVGRALDPAYYRRQRNGNEESNSNQASPTHLNVTLIVLLDGRELRFTNTNKNAHTESQDVQHTNTHLVLLDKSLQADFSLKKHNIERGVHLIEVTAIVHNAEYTKQGDDTRSLASVGIYYLGTDEEREQRIRTHNQMQTSISATPNGEQEQLKQRASGISSGGAEAETHAIVGDDTGTPTLHSVPELKVTLVSVEREQDSATTPLGSGEDSRSSSTNHGADQRSENSHLPDSAIDDDEMKTQYDTSIYLEIITPSNGAVFSDASEVTVEANLLVEKVLLPTSQLLLIFNGRRYDITQNALEQLQTADLSDSNIKYRKIYANLGNLEAGAKHELQLSLVNLDDDFSMTTDVITVTTK